MDDLARTDAITQQIQSWFGGDSVPDAVVAAIYGTLHRMAAHALARESAGHTLQPTALLHEAFLELAQRGAAYRDRQHFYATAALCMRHILVDYARRRLAAKRNADRWTESESDGAQRFLDLDAALSRLTGIAPRRAEVLQLCYFGGLKREEIAREIGVSLRTIDRELRLGEAWLAENLK